MIEVRSLSKKFGDHWALKDTSWQVQNKGSVGLLGPNGAGKSTTMKIMTGLLCSTEGQVLVDGQDIMKHPVEVKKKIGYLPETPPLYDELTVYDFFDFVCGLKSVAKNIRERQIDNSIEKLHLQEVAYKPIGVLSKGFRQRVGIGQCLLGDPQILILDEPSVGLDPHQVYGLREVIKSLKKDHTVILSTHILSEVQQICDEVVILDKGVVKSHGAISSLLNKNSSHKIVNIKSKGLSDEVVHILKQEPSVINAQVLDSTLELTLNEKAIDNLNPYLKVLIGSGCEISEITQKQNNLEDVFIEVTQ